MNAVAIACQTRPQDVTLVAKEHMSQGSPALRGFVGLSVSSCDLVSGLSNTKINGARANTSDLINWAQRVFTFPPQIRELQGRQR